MLFIGTMLICLAGTPTCEEVDFGVFTDRQLCRDTADAVKATLPPDQKVRMVACEPMPSVPTEKD